jgi:hypothetical protein
MAESHSVARWMKILGAVILLVIVVFGGWWATYPGPDPKGFMYIGWRLGLPTLNEDLALGSMVGDIHREDLVIGKTQDELIKRFGYLTSLDDTGGYNKFCYNNSDYKGKQVLFLRRSNWMVVMKDGKAADLVLVKGC